MCTAITYRTQDHYFGRTLDYGERLLRGAGHHHAAEFPAPLSLSARPGTPLRPHRHGHCGGRISLYYEATNEQGLSMAGLNFPGSADYNPLLEGWKTSRPLSSSPGSWASAPR